MHEHIHAIIAGQSVDDVIGDLLERSKLGKYVGVGAAAGGALGAAVAARRAEKGKKLKAALKGGAAGAVGGAAVGAAAHKVRMKRYDKAVSDVKRTNQSARKAFTHPHGHKPRTPDSWGADIPGGTVLNPEALKREKKSLKKLRKRFGKIPSEAEQKTHRQRREAAKNRRQETKANRTAEEMRKKREGQSGN